MFKQKQKGFTILELLVVMVIIGILAGTVLISSRRAIAQSRDARRIQELYQIANALQQYYAIYDQYPDNTDTGDVGCWSDWDAGNEAIEPDDFIKPLQDEGFLKVMPKEWTGTTVNEVPCVYRYARVQDPCDGQCPGAYAILYAACEAPFCPTGERPSCCDGSSWGEGAGENDAYDIAIFLKEK